LAFSASIFISFTNPGLENKSLRNWRVGLLLAGLVVGIALVLWPSATWTVGSVIVFIIALAEETIGRWLFYLRRNPGI
jgi:DMSO reductase anchor subunit